MASLNKVILIGRLGKDPDVTTFDNGGSKMSVTLATSENYRDKDGNWVEQTDWHNIVAWGNLASDIANKRRNYIKGDMMYIEGRLKTRQYTDSNNATRYITEVLADKMMQLSPKQNGTQSSYGQSGGQANYAQTGGGYNQPQATPTPPVAPDPMTGQTDGADDLPFS